MFDVLDWEIFLWGHPQIPWVYEVLKAVPGVQHQSSWNQKYLWIKVVLVMIHCLKKFHSKVVWPTVWSQRELRVEEGKAKKCIINLKTSLRWTLKASEALSTLLSKAKPSHIYSIIKSNFYLLRLVPSSCVHYHTYDIPANRVLTSHSFILKRK